MVIPMNVEIIINSLRYEKKQAANKSVFEFNTALSKK